MAVHPPFQSFHSQTGLQWHASEIILHRNKNKYVMKKLRFAIQIIVLIAAFPVLFIAGITHPVSNPCPEKEKNEEAVRIFHSGQTKKTCQLDKGARFYPVTVVTGFVKL